MSGPTYRRCAIRGCPFLTPHTYCPDHADPQSAEEAAVAIERDRRRQSTREWLEEA